MRLGTIFFLFMALTTVWLSMAESLQNRHLAVDSKLRMDVSQLWGSHHTQQAATLTNGSRLESAKIHADLALEYRKKGHYWYSTYKVQFQGDYELPNALPEATAFDFPLPAGSGLFNDFEVLVDDKPVLDFSQEENVVQVPLPPGAEQIRVTYVGRGSGEWWYDFETAPGKTRNLQAVVTINFQNVDFIDGSVSPDQRQSTDDGWKMEWNYNNLLTGSKIGIAMPDRSNPGPALINICRYGPLGLMLFFVSLAVCAIAEKTSPHPVHFFLLGTGFFSFHLLLVYLADATGPAAAFGIASVVAVFLNYSYACQALGREFARGRLLPALLLYLVLFSAAFLVEAYRGLLLVILMVFSLYILMRISAKVDWHALESRSRSKDPCLPN
jgi:inner membrane protein CreD